MDTEQYLFEHIEGFGAGREGWGMSSLCRPWSWPCLNSTDFFFFFFNELALPWWHVTSLGHWSWRAGLSRAKREGQCWWHLALPLLRRLRLLLHPSGDSAAGRSCCRRSQLGSGFCYPHPEQDDASSFDLLHALHLLSEPSPPQGMEIHFTPTPRSKKD